MIVDNEINKDWNIKVTNSFGFKVSHLIGDIQKILPNKTIYFNLETRQHSIEPFRVYNILFELDDIDFCSKIVKVKPIRKTA